MFFTVFWGVGGGWVVLFLGFLKILDKLKQKYFEWRLKDPN